MALCFACFAINSGYAAENSQAVALQKLDLKKTIEFALANSPVIDSLRRELSIAVLEEKTATARLLPSLDFTATHGLNDSAPRTGVGPWASKFSLGLTETLYDNGVTFTNRKLAQLTKKQTEIEFRDQRDKVILEIGKQFLLFSLETQLQEIKEKQFQLVKRQYEVISRAFYAGLRTKKDYLRFKTQVNRAEIELQAAIGSLRKAEQELLGQIGAGKTGRPPNEEIRFQALSLEKVASDLEFTPAKSDETLREHAWVRIGEIQKQIATVNADLVSRKNMPEWIFSGGVSYGSSDYLGTSQTVSDNAGTNWNALILVKYNFFDWGIRSRDSEVALQKKMIQENKAETRILALRTTLLALVSDMKREQKTFGLAKDLLNMEKINFELIEREYHSGKVQYLDLITGLSNLSDAQVKFFTAVAGLETVKLNVLYHQGKLYDEIRN
jgi:adhesin transport system outer membrane protein